MRKIILLILLIITVNCGTDIGEGKFYKYTIKNESGKSIEINAYKTSYPSSDLPNIINLNNGEKLTKTYQGDLLSDAYGFSGFFQGDSLVVKYNFERKEIFTTYQVNNERNPFFYTGTEETFIFTEQDYQNAEPCNGNCD